MHRETYSCSQHNLWSEMSKYISMRKLECKLTSEIILQNRWRFKMEYIHKSYNIAFFLLTPSPDIDKCYQDHPSH